MIVVTSRFSVAAGREREFEQRFHEHSQLLDLAPGFVGCRLLKPTGPRFDLDDGHWLPKEASPHYVAETSWQSESDFLAWTENASFLAARASTPPEGMFTEPRILEIHAVVDTHEDDPRGFN